MKQETLTQIERYLRTYKKGETLLEEGFRSELFYVLKQGTVGVYKANELITTVSVEGSYLGEMSYLLDAAHTATLVAETDCHIFVLPKQALDAMLNHSKEAGLTMMRSLANRLQIATDELAQQRTLSQEIETEQVKLKAAEAASVPTDFGHPAVEQFNQLLYVLKVMAMERPEDEALADTIRFAQKSEFFDPALPYTPSPEILIPLVQNLRGSKSIQVDLSAIQAAVRGKG